MSNFRTQYERIEKVTNPGSEIVDTYTLKDDFTLVCTGKKNIQDEIRSHRSSVELATLLQRYAQGDIEALNKRQGFFMDVSEMPDSLIGWNDSFRKANDQFESLPSDIKAAFNNSASEFWSKFGSGDFAKILTEVNKSRDVEREKKGANSNSNNNNYTGNLSGGNGGNLDE